ncbi:hypothetical protein T4A_648 [Trichinella pseudospiralis]|uniref:Uncharacterized protein n=1 Tax=Trichinella pseudospiralis TaxID=6337 RepID=A0A0V1IBV8_TRIPS|nr:hypothetical protein T4A_648 [Trichinella pseudospiralis]KRZ20333.1 hypothetical protein T4C_2894 [Trichinella pseudospiralis]KRZ33236.1 hypothetical protein T4C_9265 [Trichinella pseudospiralis]
MHSVVVVLNLCSKERRKQEEKEEKDLKEYEKKKERILKRNQTGNLAQ